MACDATPASRPPTPDSSPEAAQTEAATARGALPLGSVEVRPEACDAGGLPDTTCQVWRVRCPDLADLDARIRITSSVSGPNVLATVVLGSGGSGTGFVDAQPPMQALIQDLAQRGYRVVQRAWSSRWTDGDSGMARSACRYATLLRYVDTTVNPPRKPLCAAGNSAGGSEIAYALARYGLERSLDFALISGGPPMGRIDLGCLGGAPWDNGCETVPPENYVYDRPLECTVAAANLSLIDAPYGGAQPCRLHLESYRDTLHDDSLDSDLSDFEYPNTHVHFMYGGADYSFATSSGHMYALRVTSSTEFSYLPGVDHGIPNTTAGGAAYNDALTAGCR